MAMPEGAFYIFPDFSAFRDQLNRKGIYNSAEMCETILQETGVAFLPGSEFGRPENELTARLALVDFDGAQALANAEKTPLSEELPEQFVMKNCSRIIEAADRLCHWLNS